MKRRTNTYDSREIVRNIVDLCLHAPSCAMLARYYRFGDRFPLLENRINGTVNCDSHRAFFFFRFIFPFIEAAGKFQVRHNSFICPQRYRSVNKVQRLTNEGKDARAENGFTQNCRNFELADAVCRIVLIAGDNFP